MMAEHELVAALKQLASELERTPTQNEFLARFGGASRIKTVFGSYSVLVQAAGLEINKPGAKSKLFKLTNEIFLRPLPEVLEEYSPHNPLTSFAFQSVLVIPDIHYPFHCKRVEDAIFKKAQRCQPKYIVQVGDLYDLYAHSKFPRSLNLYSPVEEEAMAREGAENMWKTLRAASPNSKCIQIKGNHDIRPVRRTLEKQPEVEHIVSAHLDKLMTFEGVELVKDYREEYVIDGVMYHHGYRTKLGDHRDYVLRNMVVGHTHKGGVVYRRIRDEVIWELNAGFAGDPHAKVFGYMPQKTCDYTPGFGYIDEEGPRFIVA
jgi:predicted phosphodiesterase